MQRGNGCGSEVANLVFHGAGAAARVLDHALCGLTS